MGGNRTHNLLIFGQIMYACIYSCMVKPNCTVATCPVNDDDLGMFILVTVLDIKYEYVSDGSVVKTRVSRT